MHYYQDEPSGKHALCSLPGAVEPKWHLPYVIYIIPELAGPSLVPCAFIHESKLTQSSCDTLKRVWTGHGEHYAACNIIQHDRFGGGSVIVLWGISMKGCTDQCRVGWLPLGTGMKYVGTWRNWYHYPTPTATWPKSNSTDLGHFFTKLHLRLPRSSAMPWSRSGQRSCRTPSII